MNKPDSKDTILRQKDYELHRKYELKGTNDYGLNINHKEFYGSSSSGLCAGLSMFWLFCMAKEKYPDLSFKIRHFYTKITRENKDQFLSLEGINRKNFKNLCKYVNRSDYTNTNEIFEKESLKLRNSLLEYHEICNKIFRTHVCGVFSLGYENKEGHDFQEFFNALTSIINRDKQREAFVAISSLNHQMALYARRSNLKGLLDSYYEFIFYDPNDTMGESRPLILSPNQIRNQLVIKDLFRKLLGKGIRTNYFTHYNGMIFYNIFELSDLESYMITKQNRLFSKDLESLKNLKILGINNNYSKSDEEIRLFFILFNSCYYCIYSVVKALQRHQNIDPNKTTSENRSTPLYMAAHNGHAEVIRALSKFKNIDPNKTSENRSTPLYIAAQNGHAEVIKALSEFNNIDPNKTTKDSVTPLYIASQNGHTDVVEALQGFKGIDPNKPTKDGITPLMIASQIGHTKTVRALLCFKNIDRNKATDGFTALKIAQTKGFLDIIEMLSEVPINTKEQILLNLSLPSSYNLKNGRLIVKEAFFNKKIYSDLDKQSSIFKMGVSRSAIYAISTIYYIESMNTLDNINYDNIFLFMKNKKYFYTKIEENNFQKNKSTILKYVDAFKKSLKLKDFISSNRVGIFGSATNYKSISKEYFKNLEKLFIKYKRNS